MNDATTKETTLTVGLDVGDRHVQVCVLDETGEIVEESRLPTKAAALLRANGRARRTGKRLNSSPTGPWFGTLKQRGGQRGSTTLKETRSSWLRPL